MPGILGVFLYFNEDGDLKQSYKVHQFPGFIHRNSNELQKFCLHLRGEVIAQYNTAQLQ